jgi:anti-sigma factor RsiW
MSTCHRIDELRDYAFDELAVASRPSLEQHLNGCSECAGELDRLRLTTAALRVVPDREIPQRIAFVSDKIFEPSPVRRWLGGFWNSGARLGFASACVLAAAIVISAYHRPAVVSSSTAAAIQPAAVQTASASPDLTKQIDDAVTKAMVRVRAEDTQMLNAALAESDRKHEQERRALMIAVGENLDYWEKRLGTMTMLASSDTGARP